MSKNVNNRYEKNICALMRGVKDRGRGRLKTTPTVKEKMTKKKAGEIGRRWCRSTL